MKIRLNGEDRAVAERSTVADLLSALELTSGRVAVEVNKSVVPRARHPEVVLHEGDQVEIVGFVGGG